MKDVPREDFVMLPKTRGCQDRSLPLRPSQDVRTIFADTFPWTALTSLGDTFYLKALKFSSLIASALPRTYWSNTWLSCWPATNGSMVAGHDAKIAWSVLDGD